MTVHSFKRENGKWARVINSKPTTECVRFKSAQQRCTNPNHERYSDYGGRGIVHKLDFDEMMDELGPVPDGYYLDRIDNDGHYELGNVRWAPGSISNKNTRKRSRAGSIFIRRFIRRYKTRTGTAIEAQIKFSVPTENNIEFVKEWFNAGKVFELRKHIQQLIDEEFYGDIDG